MTRLTFLRLVFVLLWTGCSSFSVLAPSAAAARSPDGASSALRAESDGSSNDGDSMSGGKRTREGTWNPLRLAVLRLGLTELRFTSPLNYGKYDGVFVCAYCNNRLFDSSAKYDSGSGWPSFWRSLDDASVSYKREFDGRLECRCAKCSSHLGHVFLDGPRPSDVPRTVLDDSPASDPRSKRADGRLPRFCVNGASLKVTDRDA